MSTGLGITTILGCLEAGEKLMGLSPEAWEEGGSPSVDQTLFLANQLNWRPGLSKFAGESLRSFATNKHAEVSAKMAEWKMRLDDLPDSGPFAIYMISQLREYLEWCVAGKPVMREWPEFILKGPVRFYDVGLRDNYLVEVQVKNGDFVYLLRHKQPRVGFDLWRAIRTAELGMEKPVYLPQYGTSVQIPCVYADLVPDMNWILGMTNGDYYISYAQQKILFGMNQLGFAVREETGMVAKEMCMLVQPEPYILSPRGESFLFWRRRAGVSFPISMFQFTKEDFRDPGDLKKIVE